MKFKKKTKILYLSKAHDVLNNVQLLYDISNKYNFIITDLILSLGKDVYKYTNLTNSTSITKTSYRIDRHLRLEFSAIAKASAMTLSKSLNNLYFNIEDNSEIFDTEKRKIQHIIEQTANVLNDYIGYLIQVIKSDRKRIKELDEQMIDGDD